MAYRLNAMLCMCTNCISNGALSVKQALEAEIEKKGLSDEIQLVKTGASGFCVKGPVLIIQPDGVFYQHLNANVVPKLVEEHFLKGRPVETLLYVQGKGEPPIPRLMDIPFFKTQRLIALRNRGIIDPDKIDEYIAVDGYKALAKVLTEMTPDQVIEEVLASGLRGRGGGGFPTGRKWQFCRAEMLKRLEIEPDADCYIICNADEGDPGAFMDRSIIEADPHVIIEGMVIAAYAIGATEGYVYIRVEYPLAIERLNHAVKQAREYGLLGQDILGTGFNFDLKIFEGAGAFVCGEENSLIRSIEGNIPEPQQRPPFPAKKGLWGMPTNINNVETWANIPMIINWGHDWYKEMGTDLSKGTKVFSLAGKINNAGLVEVPMGITLKEIIFDIGGGIPNDKKFKAVQTGGPSGGFIPESLLHLPVDYEQLAAVGTIMGSGGMIVLDEDNCIVDVAEFFLHFTGDESCGKCISCREGARALLKLLDKIRSGEGELEDLQTLQDYGEAIIDASLCGLGQTLPKPVLSAIRHFRDEFIEHIVNKRCPAGVCKKLVTFTISEEKCVGCTVCAKACPVNAISGELKKLHKIDQTLCTKCGECYAACRFNAVKKG